MSVSIKAKMIRLGGTFIMDAFLRKIVDKKYSEHFLSQYGQRGCDALAKATPVDSGETAQSWSYEIEHNKDGYTIYWVNSHVNKTVNIAIILQYGHGTGTGGYVEGIDYINPALRPIFQNIADEAWQEMMK